MKNLTGKLVKVMLDVKRVAKNGRNEFHKYDYVTEADVLDTVRESLAKHNVFIFSSVEASHKDGDLTSVVVKHTVVDADSGEQMDVKSLGQGSDKSDKGSNKAITSAMKYFLLKNFLIPTGGDDVEATDETGKSTGGVKREKPPLSAVSSTSDATNPGETPKKKYGFAGKPKPVAAKATEVSTDEF